MKTRHVFAMFTVFCPYSLGGRTNGLLCLSGPGNRVLGRRAPRDDPSDARPRCRGHRTQRQRGRQSGSWSRVRDCIAQGVDGIIIIPQDGASAITIIGEANSADVPIAVFKPATQPRQPKRRYRGRGR